MRIGFAVVRCRGPILAVVLAGVCLLPGYGCAARYHDRAGSAQDASRGGGTGADASRGGLEAGPTDARARRDAGIEGPAVKADHIVITWELPEPRAEPVYLVNGTPVGKGDTGFDRVLVAVRGNPTAEVTVRLAWIPLGGQDVYDALPFKARLHEFMAAMGPRTFVFSM
jgi:hypothetical protein